MKKAKSISHIRDNLKKYDELVTQYNFRSLGYINWVGLISSAVLVLLSLPGIGILKLSGSYMILCIVFAITFMCYYFIVRHNKKWSLLLYYIMMTAIISVSIYMGTYAGINTNGTTFLLLLFLFPILLVDNPFHIIIFNILATAIFIYTDIMCGKAFHLLSLDIANTITVCIFSSMFVALNVRRIISSFELRQGEINKSREQEHLLNSVPIGISIYDINQGNIVQRYTNDGFYALFEDTREDRTKRAQGQFINSIHPEDRPRILAMIKKVIDGANDAVDCCRAVKGDSSYIWVRYAISVAKRATDYIEVYCVYSSMEEEVKNRQASEAKTTFLSRMSHDIRTPMNAIIGLTELAGEEEDIGKIKEYLGYIDHSSHFLLGLINDVLDLSKIESGEFTLNPEPYYLEEFLENINTIIKPLMDQKHITFVMEMNCNQSCIITDRLRFNQIFFNLLSNAQRYTDEGGSILFRADYIGEKDGLHGIRFIVEDNGIGMSDEYQKNLFTPFVQENDNYDMKEKGTGLGLPIVKSILEAMQGDITVESQPGNGTKFIVDLHVEIPDNQEKIPIDNLEVESLKGMRVLLTEDNKTNIIVATKILEKMECVVTVATNGQECLDAYLASECNYYDVILMDVRMPVMDGLETTRRIRNADRADAKSIVIIAMTADAFSEEKKKTIEAGMNEHLSKPIDVNKLKKTLCYYWKR